MYLIYLLFSFAQEPQDEEIVATPPVVESEKSVKTDEMATTAPPDIRLETSHATLEPYDPNVPVGKLDFFSAKKEQVWHNQAMDLVC